MKNKIQIKNNILKFTYRSLLLLVSSIFIFVGIDKIFLAPEMVKMFSVFGLPKEFMVIIGFTELVLAIMLQSKYFTKLATHGIISILSFATFFHFVNGQYFYSLIPTLFIVILIITLNLGQKIKNLSL
jgi:uncharacterized membrane protein YphA (DoxX/SURF4 family)